MSRRNVKKYFVLLVFAVLVMVLMGACASKTVTQIVEVTRIAQAEGAQLVEVTRLVEITRIVEVEKEVTRDVLVEPTTAPAPEAGKLQVYGISDIVQLVDRTVTVNDAQVVGEILKINITRILRPRISQIRAFL